MNNNQVISLISRQNIIDAGCVDYGSIIRVIEDVFKDYKSGSIMLPEKISQVFNEETQDRINCMPSTLFNEKICGVKWVSVFPDNPHKYGVENVSGIIILSEIETGFPIAVMDGTLLTSLRTGCMGAIGAKYLAKQNAEIYCSIGAGEEDFSALVSIRNCSYFENRLAFSGVALKILAMSLSISFLSDCK